MLNYCQYFGFKNEPFSNEISTKNLLKLPAITAVKERFDYVLSLGSVLLVTGDVGSGKSTSIRYSEGHYHASQNIFINITCTTGSIIELYRQICWGLDIDMKSGSKAFILKTLKNIIKDIVTTKKQKIIIVLDEAHLLRTDIFFELHTLLQFNNDSKNYLSLVFVGLTNLIDKLSYRTSAALASRIVSKTHLTALNREQIQLYINHHLKIAGFNKELFGETALTAIHQGSSGILRKINFLSRGALIAAATEKQDQIIAEHVRIASTELI